MSLVVMILAIVALIGFAIGFLRWDQNMPVNTTAGGLFCAMLAALLHFGGVG